MHANAEDTLFPKSRVWTGQGDLTWMEFPPYGSAITWGSCAVPPLGLPAYLLRAEDSGVAKYEKFLRLHYKILLSCEIIPKTGADDGAVRQAPALWDSVTAPTATLGVMVFSVWDGKFYASCDITPQPWDAAQTALRCHTAALRHPAMY